MAPASHKRRAALPPAGRRKRRRIDTGTVIRTGVRKELARSAAATKQLVKKVSNSKIREHAKKFRGRFRDISGSKIVNLTVHLKGEIFLGCNSGPCETVQFWNHYTYVRL